MNWKHLPILAIDPSVNMGYAFWNPDTKKVNYGTWRLGGEHIGERYSNFLKRITEYLSDVGFNGDLSLKIVIEAPAPNSNHGWTQLLYSIGWIGVLEMYCFQNNYARPSVPPIVTWRNYFIAKTIPRQLRGTSSATQWYKDQVMHRCNEFGLKPEDDNSADAIGILKWAVDGGAIEYEKRQAAKKAEAVEKRKQKTLELIGGQNGPA